MKGDFDRAFFVSGGKTPLFDGAGSGLDEDGVATNRLNILYGSVWTDGNPQLDYAADSFVAEHSGIFWLNPFQNFAVGVLRKNDARAESENQCQTCDLRQSAGSG